MRKDFTTKLGLSELTNAIADEKFCDDISF
jgi:hypothetical protein